MMGGVVFVGKTVPNGDTGVATQLFHQLLAEATVLDAVKHATQHSGGIGDGLFFAHLRAGGI